MRTAHRLPHALSLAITGLAAAALAALRPARAQQARGDKELGLGGTFQVTTPKEGGSSTVQGSVVATLGLFATRNVKLIVGTSLNAVTGSGEQGTLTTGLVTYGASYYFGGRGARTYPYLGVGGGTSVSSVAGAPTQTNVNGFAGLQHFVSRRASFYVQGDYIPSSGATTLLNTFGLRLVF